METTSTPAADADDRAWMGITASTLALIWVAVLLISLLAPDLVSGSRQEHLPLAAFTTWLWGAVATGAALFTLGRLRGVTGARPIWTGYAIAVAVIWIVTTVLSIALPVLETGSDPTQLPLAALVAPLAAAVLTTLAGIVAIVFSRPPTPR